VDIIHRRGKTPGFHQGMNASFRVWGRGEEEHPSHLTDRTLETYNLLMLKTFKYRLYPNKQQQRLLDQQLEECRWLYNHLLAERRDAW
jgi:hypothetical protein